MKSLLWIRDPITRISVDDKAVTRTSPTTIDWSAPAEAMSANGKTHIGRIARWNGLRRSGCEADGAAHHISLNYHGTQVLVQLLRVFLPPHSQPHTYTHRTTILNHNSYHGRKFL